MSDRTYRFTMTGQTPLLMHADNLKWADKMQEWRLNPENRTKSVAGDDRTPAFRWIGSLWNDGKHVAIPQSAISKILTLAGTKVQTGKGKATFKSQAAAGIICTDAHYRFEGSKGQIPMSPIYDLMELANFADHEAAVIPMGFELDVQRSRPQTSKHVRVRPRFDVWTCTGTVDVVDDDITDQVLKQIWNIGGKRVGIGNWRASAPMAPGPFGKFTSTVERVD